MDTLDVPPPEALRRAIKNPAEFCEKVIGGPPRWSKQVEILESVRDHRETYAMSCHGTGKSFITADLVLWFLFTHYPSKVVTIAPSQRQVKDVLWGEIRTKYRQSKLPPVGRYNEQSLRLELGPDHYAEGFSPDVENAETDQGVKLQGYHSPNMLVVFEEAPGVDEALWKAKDSLMTGRKSKFLAIGNPIAATGPFYESWARKRGYRVHLDPWSSPNFVANKIRDLEDLRKLAKKGESAWSTLILPYPGLLTPSWAADMLNKWGEDSALFKSRVLGEFPVAGLDNLLSLAELELCTKVERPGVGGKVRVLGIDPARYGSNNTAIVGMQGFRMVYRKSYQGMDLTFTANLACKLLQEGKFEAVSVDVDGIGAGVADRIREWREHAHRLDIRIFEVHNAGVAGQADKFQNLRAEQYWRVRELVKNQNIALLDEGELFHQLSAIRYKFTSGGKVEIESKESMKRRGINSPDEADALCLACHAVAQISGAGTAGTNWLTEILEQDDDRETAKRGWE